MKWIEINQDNFYLGTKCRFKGCKKPKRKADYTSYNRDQEISSEYWYGEDKNGKYVIRCSKHWSRTNSIGELLCCGKIASCYWWLITNCKKSYEYGIFERFFCGKAYFSNFESN
ncbi:MAG: hypothetical protein Q8Q67_01955 [bacterium]|nr:hypothetical protein [bacterium]